MGFVLWDIGLQERREHVSPGRPGNNITGASGSGGVGVEGMEIDTVASCWANSEVRSAGSIAKAARTIYRRYGVTQRPQRVPMTARRYNVINRTERVTTVR